jgi:hypothetical protein
MPTEYGLEKSTRELPIKVIITREFEEFGKKEINGGFVCPP